jgi:hypothetical protein
MHVTSLNKPADEPCPHQIVGDDNPRPWRRLDDITEYRTGDSDAELRAIHALQQGLMRLCYVPPPPGGCSIHPTRPEECRLYDCLWMQGMGPDSWRPDRCGLVLDSTRHDGPLGKAGEVVVAHETEADVIWVWVSAAARVLDKLRDKGVRVMLVLAK